MTWETYLADGEELRWEGRPAPRCYTFRRWKEALFGLVLVVMGAWWEIVGLQLAPVYDLPWLAWIPLPVWLFGLYLSVGRLTLARVEWEHLFYAVTDRRVLVHRGGRKTVVAELPLDEVTFFQLKPLGRELGSVRIFAGDRQRRLVLSCLEYPRRVTDLLEEAMRQSGVLTQESI